MAKSSLSPKEASRVAADGQSDASPDGGAATGEAARHRAEIPITSSRGIARWLASQRVSLVMTCYQTGWLCLFGVRPSGRLSMNVERYRRTMGVCVAEDQIYLGGLAEIWRLSNVLGPNERANQDFDRLYFPRTSQTTGDIDIHELAMDRAGRLVFVNTRFSCLAVLSPVYGFAPIWKPPFVSKLAGEDRCHLNGLAMEGGLPRYVTAASASDSVTGWRERRHEGGVVVDVLNNRILTDRLSMPHSPRVHDGQLWALDSGRGYLIRINRETGAAEDVAFCPGFLRGLAFSGHFAVVTASLPRDKTFEGLPLSEELTRRNADPWCALFVIDLNRGDVVEWIRFEGEITELFDVAVMPGVTCPMTIGPRSAEVESLLSYDGNWAPLDPTAQAKAAAS